MMKIQSLFVLGTLGLGTAAMVAPVMAQGGPPAGGGSYGQRGGGGGGAMIKQLGLTKAQMMRIKAIRQASRQQVQALRANTSLTPAQRQAQVRAIMEGNRTRMMAVLTPAQQQKLMQMRSQRRAQKGAAPTG